MAHLLRAALRIVRDPAPGSLLMGAGPTERLRYLAANLAPEPPPLSDLPPLPLQSAPLVAVLSAAFDPLHDC